MRPSHAFAPSGLSTGAGPVTQLETSVLARPEAISALTDRVMTFLSEKGVDARAAHHVALVLEEVLGNLGTHGNCRDTPARISVRIGPDKVRGEVVDAGPPFDPRLAPPPPLDVGTADRPIGGLGLHLVRQLSSDLEYARSNGENFMSFAVKRT
jgi:serine/threonine-protein kinase RsbW